MFKTPSAFFFFERKKEKLPQVLPFVSHPFSYLIRAVLCKSQHVRTFSSHDYKQKLQGPVTMFSHKVLVMYFPQSTLKLINVHQKDIISAIWAVTIQHSPGCPSNTSSGLKLSIIFTRNKGRGRPTHLQHEVGHILEWTLLRHQQVVPGEK